jgi:hypothetical protein
MNKLTALIAVAGIAGLLGATAEAATTPDVPTETVRYADLNTAKGHDVVVLFPHRRALQRAVAAINAPAVTAYAEAQGVALYDSRIARSN